MTHTIEIAAQAEKEIARLPKGDQRRVVRAIRNLSHDPRPRGSVKITDSSLYRMRVGVYRVIYAIEDDKLIVCIVRVRHRKDAYRKL